MSNDISQIGNRAWSFAHVLRDDGLSYMSYIEQITFLLFLKMAEETATVYKRDPLVPEPWNWANLIKRDGDDLETHYRKTLEELGRHKGMLGVIFLKAKNEITDPAKLRRLIVELIEPVKWVNLGADVKGTVYEELLQRSAAESPKGAGQYFTPRPVIEAIVDVMKPGPDDSVMDPCCGTGGFLLAAHDYVMRKHGADLNRTQKKYVKDKLIEGVELVPNTARLCAMNLHLHGIGGDDSPIHAGIDSLAKSWGEQYSMVLTNPPFGKKSSVSYVNDEGELEREKQTVVREDFFGAATSNKQLNFVQHIYTLLKVNGRAAVVVPDNVLFEGGAGEKIRRRLLAQCDVHTLLRLPTGIWYSPGVKANVLFFDRKPGAEKPWTKKLWVYDLRTNMHFTLKQKSIGRADFDEFVKCYKPGAIHKRKPLWSEDNLEGRWRCFDYDDLLKRDKLSLDLFWLRDESLDDGEGLPDPDVLATEIADDLQAALEQFQSIAADLNGG